MMKKYKVRIYGLGIDATAIIPFDNEPTQETLENNVLKSGFIQLSKNETPAYEVLSGAAIAFAAILLIIPGFATDIIGFLLIFPFTRKIIFRKFTKKQKKNTKKDYIDGDFEDIEDDHENKI